MNKAVLALAVFFCLAYVAEAGLRPRCPPRDRPDRPATILPDLRDCSRFYICSNGKAYRYDCPANLHFNPILRVCDYPERANCWGWISDDEADDIVEVMET